MGRGVKKQKGGEIKRGDGQSGSCQMSFEGMQTLSVQRCNSRSPGWLATGILRLTIHFFFCLINCCSVGCLGCVATVDAISTFLFVWVLVTQKGEVLFSLHPL